LSGTSRREKRIFPVIDRVLKKRSIWWLGGIVAFFLVSIGPSKRIEKVGLDFLGVTSADHVRLLVDETWVDAQGNRQVRQEIFAAVFEMIDEADEFILLDFFLVNNFLYEPASGLREMSSELTDKLIAKRKANPDVKIIFITDPVNTVYGAIESPLFSAMERSGIQVVWTDLNRLRDSNPIISKPWRVFVKPWGVGSGNAIKNPMGEGRISLRSFLKMLNFKANHRKVVITEKSFLVTSANPHSGSSAHWNVGLRVDGAGMILARTSETAVLRLSGVSEYQLPLFTPPEKSGKYQLELLTEKKIKQKVLALLGRAKKGTRVDLCMFYLSDRKVIAALIEAKKAGADVRVILDPNKDAFGRTKNGIPNRQSAAKLVKAGIPLRWANTHGEQCHAKMLYVKFDAQTATLLLGSCNYTRRNMDNFNLECDLAVTTQADDSNLQRACRVFDRRWSNPDGRNYTLDYEKFKDTARSRRLLAAWMEFSGMGTF